MKAGLTGEAPPLALFKAPVDWDAVYKISFDQTVVSIVTDGISLLPDEMKPEIDALEPFLADTLATEIRNDQMDRFLVGMMEALDREGLRPLVIKGQCLALNYPHPNHRQSGDIDLLVPPSRYKPLRDYLVAKAGHLDKEYEQVLHQGMMFGSVEVEVHGSIATQMSFNLDRRLSDEIVRIFAEEDFSEAEIRGKAVRCPGDVFNAVYIFLHMYRHYFSGGVGLRQICDWAMFLHARRETLDRGLLGSRLRDLGLMRAWKVFGAFAVEYAGIPAGDVPFYTPVGRARLERILSFVFKCGNFGSNEDRVRGSEPYIIRKIHSFLLLDVHDKLRHFTEFPGDSLRFFFGAVSYGFHRLFKGV